MSNKAFPLLTAYTLLLCMVEAPQLGAQNPAKLINETRNILEDARNSQKGNPDGPVLREDQAAENSADDGSNEQAVADSDSRASESAERGELFFPSSVVPPLSDRDEYRSRRQIGADEYGEDEETQAKRNELMRLATSSFRRQRLDDTVRYINDLIAMQPYEAKFHFALALCFRKLGKNEETLRKYQDVLDLGSSQGPLVHVFKAEIYALGGNEDKVFETLKQAAIGGRNVISDVHDLPLLAKYGGETEFIRLALQLERFEVKKTLWDDPFTNVFRKQTGDEENLQGKEKLHDGPWNAERQAVFLRAAKREIDLIEFYVKLQDEDKAMKSYMKIQRMVSQANKLTIPKIEKDFNRIVKKIPDIEIKIQSIRLRYYYNKAKQQLSDMREVFDDGDYARVETIHISLEALAREMKKASKNYTSVADEIVERSNRWVLRARVRLEFEERKPEIQGIIISEGERRTILDARIVDQGDSLNGFRVVRIESNRVTFRYKGEEIPMVFRRY